MNEPPSLESPLLVRPDPSKGRAWKNWESEQCIDWVRLLDRVQAKIEVHHGFTPFIIVEGFLILENESLRQLCDHIVSIRVSKEVAWQRRLTRALQMATGAKDASGMADYEKLEVYAVQEDHATIRRHATEAVENIGRDMVYQRPSRKTACGVDDDGVQQGPWLASAMDPLRRAGKRGDYDWLRLYFDEVVWREAERVRGRVDEVARAGSTPVHEVNGDLSPKDVQVATNSVITDILASLSLCDAE
mmetsp:Transcript_1301/g.4192  ORF Transcript_1301/g.4192 Transcript_1301/m.4192 type:complete len:246 (+) Transcript_1301:162-899(+)